MTYVEFLECLCRMALVQFEPSELKDMPLAEKLAYTLQSLFVQIEQPLITGEEEADPFFEESDGETTVDEPLPE